MFRGCISLTNFTSDLRQCENGYCMFDGCKNLENFNVPNLGGGSSSSQFGRFESAYGMFRGCHSLKNFGSNGEVFRGYDFPYLMFANCMFKGCASLKEVDCMFSALTDGDYMFYGCSSLESFSGELCYVTNASYMFADCKNLSSFTLKGRTVDMPYMLDLREASCMFYGCTSLNIDSFSAIFGCTSAYHMFAGCYSLGGHVDVHYKNVVK